MAELWQEAAVRSVLQELPEKLRGQIPESVIEKLATLIDEEKNNRPQYRHKKRGSFYEVLGEGEVQISTPASVHQFLLGAQRFIKEGDKLVVYRNKERKLWLRFPDEFYDGRFEMIDNQGKEIKGSI